MRGCWLPCAARTPRELRWLPKISYITNLRVTGLCRVRCKRDGVGCLPNDTECTCVSAAQNAGQSAQPVYWRMAT
jgi:hypothetical protein